MVSCTASRGIGGGIRGRPDSDRRRLEPERRLRDEPAKRRPEHGCRDLVVVAGQVPALGERDAEQLCCCREDALVQYPLQLQVGPQQSGVELVTLRLQLLRKELPVPWLQRIVFGLLAPIGRARGLEPYYQRYIDSEVVVEPDPAALEQDDNLWLSQERVQSVEKSLRDLGLRNFTYETTALGEGQPVSPKARPETPGQGRRQ